MSGSEHYALAAQHAEIAAELFDDGDTLRANQRLSLAQVHARLAQAAATALGAVLPLVGGDSDEVTAWARMIGAIDEPRQDDVVEATIYPEHWPPMVGDLWANASGHRRWLARRVPDGLQMVSCWDEDPWEGAPDFCTPDELLKAHASLVLLNREEPPF